LEKFSFCWLIWCSDNFFNILSWASKFRRVRIFGSLHFYGTKHNFFGKIFVLIGVSMIFLGFWVELANSVGYFWLLFFFKVLNIELDVLHLSFNFISDFQFSFCSKYFIVLSILFFGKIFVLIGRFGVLILNWKSYKQIFNICCLKSHRYKVLVWR
jgi:hypothetical protein